MPATMAVRRRDEFGRRSEGCPGAERPGGCAGAKPHVCFVAPYLWPVLSRDPGIKIVGGAEVQQSILARLLVRNGYRVSAVTLDYGQPDGVVVDGVTVHKTYGMEEGIPVLRFLHPRLTRLWGALRASDADIYYQRSASMTTGVVAEFARRHGRRAIYAGASDNDFQRGREQIRFTRDRWLYWHGVAKVDRVVAQNPEQVRLCREQFGRDATLIPSCYELPEHARPLSDDLVLWVATIHEYKRPEWVLEVAKRLPHRRFVMIGGVSTRGTRLTPGYYESIQRAAGALPNVEFKGFLPLAQAEAYFDRARVFLNTSVHEGVPNTFMQSWARGVPTVSTVDIGARSDGEPVYPMVQDAEGAAAEVERLCADELYWARASARCRGYFEANHSPAQTLARYERLFGELAKA
jgi:glycosyltransferase involved in cell wall biosynthesis